MALIQKNLRCDVLRSTADCVGSLSHYLSEAEVNQLQESILCYHDVLRL